MMAIPSTVKIDADNTYINVTSGNKVPTAGEYNNIGIVNYSGAKVIINGNLTVGVRNFFEHSRRCNNRDQ